MRILNYGTCPDETKLFSDVYNQVIIDIENSGKDATIPIFTDAELDWLDDDFDFYEADIEETELVKMILYKGEEIAIRLLEDYESHPRKFRKYKDGKSCEEYTVEVQRPY